MKKLTILFFPLLLFAACNQKPIPAGNGVATENGKENTQTIVGKFNDPQRIHTCEQFINYLKTNDLEDALSFVNMDHYTDREMNEESNNREKEYVENIRLALKSCKVTPKEEWEIKFDTAHFKINTGHSLVSCISILEYINIRLDRGPEPIDSQIFVNVAFNVTDLDPNPNIIDGAILAPWRYLNSRKSNKNIEGY